jgi:hypothetical protein
MYKAHPIAAIKNTTAMRAARSDGAGTASPLQDIAIYGFGPAVTL